MTALVTSLGGKLAERWLAGLMLPGVVFVCVAAIAAELGQAHWSELALLRTAVDRFAASPTAHSNGAIALIALVTVALAVAASALAQALTQLVVRMWTGTWGRCGLPLVNRRRRRWREAVLRHEDALRKKARQLRGVHPSPAPRTLPDTAALAAARDRIALTQPQMPTWMGDRMRAVEERVRTAYDLDLATVWPRLWLTLSEEARAPLTHARTDLTSAARTASWGSLYLVLGLWWWPAALIGAGAWTLAWWQGRTSMEHLAQLVESTIDLHINLLATALGRTVEGPFTPADGESVTRILHKEY